MPARFAARFERDQILMPQLVDDLPRGRRCAAAGVLATNTWPPVHVARSLKRTGERRPSADLVERSVDGLSIDGTMPKM